MTTPQQHASNRVGGAKKVSNRLGIEEVLFIKYAKNQKRYYAAADAENTFLQFLKMEDKAYREFLDGEGLP